MKILKILLLMISCTVMLVAKPVIIVNTGNSISELPKAMVKRLYTGRLKKVGDAKAIVINQDYSSPITAEFLSTYIGQTPEQYKEFWVSQQIKGLGSAPMIHKSDAAVISMVSSIPGAIGYVDEASVTDKVKVVTIK